jgi:hypothetical protein
MKDNVSGINCQRLRTVCYSVAKKYQLNLRVIIVVLVVVVIPAVIVIILTVPAPSTLVPPLTTPVIPARCMAFGSLGQKEEGRYESY